MSTKNKRLQKPIKKQGGRKDDDNNTKNQIKPNAHVSEKNDWEMIALGTRGGIVSGDLSSYILKSTHTPGSQQAANTSDNKWIAFDGGSPIDGLWKWNSENNKSDQVSLDDIEAFLISHAHLDHISGFAILTPSLMQRKTSKLKLIANSNVMWSFGNFVFNDYLWPSVLWDDKFVPLHKITVSPHQTLNINSNTLIESLPIQHGNYGKYNAVKEKQEDSTVFLVTNTLSDKTVVYFGDVTSQSHVTFLNSNDSNSGRKLKKQQQLAKKQLLGVWNRLSGLVISCNLSAIFIECAFSSKCPMLFGHMNAKLLAAEFDILQRLVTNTSYKAQDEIFSGITLIITHLKPDISGTTSDIEEIKGEVVKELGRFRFKKIIFPEQGKKYNF